MQQTFVFSYGKVVLENGILYIRKTKPSLTVSEAVTTFFPLFLGARFFLHLGDDDSAKRNLGLVTFGFLTICFLLLNVKTYYKIMFKRSFATRIPIKNIQSFRLIEDPNELDAHFFLKLKSGRERKITFRKLEKQYEELAYALAQSISITKLAC